MVVVVVCVWGGVSWCAALEGACIEAQLLRSSGFTERDAVLQLPDVNSWARNGASSEAPRHMRTQHLHEVKA